jgi:glycosyltransferase involved in cell wall biosynthesis
MKKIKVAFFAEILTEDFDGASRTMFQLINRIRTDQFEFLFICGSGPSEIAGFECFPVPSITLPINQRYTMALPHLADTQLKRKLSAFSPDVIHIATPSILGNYALEYARERNIPVLTIYHTHFISYVDYYLSKARFLIDFAKTKIAASQKAFYNQCDIIYVPSESIAMQMQTMGIEMSRIKIWKRGIDTMLFSPEKRNRDSIRLLTGNDNPNILFASRLVWEKNLEVLIRIYNACQIQQLPYNFIIAGDGTAKSDCQKQMKNAVFTGNLDHLTLSELYASSDLFLFTSISETYGNVVLEAMASGLPCIIADGGGSRDVVTHGVNGFKCQPQQEDDYISKIKILLHNHELRKQFSAEGRTHSLNLDWNKLADVYFEELQNLTGVFQINE